MLRGHIDKIPDIPGYNKVTVETMLNSDILSLRLAVDGPPGIGKTTLCRKLLNIWSKGSHELQHYDLVLHCPLRHKAVAEATELADLFVYKTPKVSKVVDWVLEREGKGLLIIFDGWDELSTQLRESSLATSIICKDQLVYSSVIVTSRTYATTSLLQLECLNQNVHVIGFVADEIDEVIKETLSQELAEKLIKDLDFRNDVFSLCYVPLVCSMVILVYRKSGGHLPATISELYENFILQTIRRHVKKTSNNLVPQSLESLNNLPSTLNASLQQMCEFAYLSLKKENNKMTFTHSQIHSLDIATKENYLGMITSITDFDEEWYQFIHLSIQEFLASWWIAKNEKTEEMFKNCFEDDHFRLCLRFVAGITKLEHESYQQYFNTTVFDLQCKKRPLFEIETTHSWITPDMHHVNLSLQKFPYISKSMVKFCTLLHLLYESQNIELCHILAQSIKNYSICLGNISFSNGWQPPFDTLCLTYFIHNSNTSWNYLHFYPYEFVSQWNIINEEIKKSTAQSKTVSINDLPKLVQWPQYFNIQEFYCDSFMDVKEFLVFVTFFSKLPQLRKLHLRDFIYEANELSQAAIFEPSSHRQILVELEESIVNSQLQELYFNIKEQKLQLENISFITDIVATLFKGVTRSKTIRSFKIEVEGSHNCPPLPDGIIENLLQNNKTLQELSLKLPNHFIPSTLNIKEINAPLTTLEFDEAHAIFEKKEQCKIMLALFPHTKGLKHLKLMLYNLYPPYPLLLSNSNLQYLSLQLHTLESVIELFESLTSNTTLLGLKVRIRLQRCFNSGTIICIHNLVRTYIGKNLENLLTNNQILQHLEIIGLDIPYVLESELPFWNHIPNFFLHFLNKGLVHNKSLKHLTVPIEIPKERLKCLTIFFNTLSQKKILTELQLDMRISDNDAIVSFFSENGLPHFTNVLRSVRTLKILRVEFKCSYSFNSSQQELPRLSTIKKCVNDFMDAVIFHPSLEYVHLSVSINVQNIFEEQLKRIMKTYKEQEQKPPPHIDLTDRLNLKEY